MDPTKLAEIFSDERQMQRMVEGIRRIEEAVVSIADKFGPVGEKIKDTLDAADEGLTRAKEGIKDTSAEFEKLNDIAEVTHTRLEKIRMQFERIKQTAAGFGNRFVAPVMEAGVGLQTNAESQVMRLIRGLPAGLGPTLEFMLNTARRGDAFNTSGRGAFMQFQGTSNLNADQVTKDGERIGATMKRLEENFLGTKEEVQAVFAALAQGGVKAREAIQHTNKDIEGFGDTVAMTSLGVDKAFALVVGTVARAATTLTRDTNVGLKDSVQLVEDIGAASRQTGLDMQAMLGTILQVTSALRLQGGDAKALTGTFLKMQEAFRTMMPGAENIRVSALAQDALQSLPQFVQGLGEGIKGIIGPEVAKTLTGKEISDPLEALRQMSTGFQFAGRREGVNFEGTVAEKTFQLLSKSGQTDAEVFRLLTQFGNMTPLLAEFMIQTRGAGFTGTGEKVEDARKQFEALKESQAKLEPLKTSTFEKLIGDIQSLMFSLGQAMISLLGGILQAIAGLGKVFAAEGTTGKLAALSELNAKAFDPMIDAFSKVGSRIQALVGHIGEGLNVENDLATAAGLSEAQLNQVRERRGVREAEDKRKADLAEQYKSFSRDAPLSPQPFPSEGSVTLPASLEHGITRPVTLRWETDRTNKYVPNTVAFG